MCVLMQDIYRCVCASKTCIDVCVDLGFYRCVCASRTCIDVCVKLRHLSVCLSTYRLVQVPSSERRWLVGRDVIAGSLEHQVVVALDRSGTQVMLRYESEHQILSPNGLALWLANVATFMACSDASEASTLPSLSPSEVCQATHCNALQRTATHCNTLQHNATHCNTLQHASLQESATECKRG